MSDDPPALLRPAVMAHFAAVSGVGPKPINVNQSMASWQWLGVTRLVKIKWRREECHLNSPVVEMFFPEAAEQRINIATLAWMIQSRLVEIEK